MRAPFATISFLMLCLGAAAAPLNMLMTVSIRDPHTVNSYLEHTDAQTLIGRELVLPPWTPPIDYARALSSRILEQSLPEWIIDSGESNDGDTQIV
ncbi:hypothetical protein PENSPDRAFT_684521 [Peniophora sp. CONT]|nr:hypothetical protein PENSPDRAFT_684521 [Peniophora sp. CONT]